MAEVQHTSTTMASSAMQRPGVARSRATVRPTDQFDRIAALVRTMLRVDAVAITLNDIPGLTGGCPQVLAGAEGFSLSPAAVVCTAHDLPEDEAVTLRSRLGAPLVSGDGRSVGALVVFSRARRRFSAADRATLSDFASLVTAAHDLWLQASRDALTGALTRRAFIDAAEGALARHQRSERPLTAVMFDLDHFKSVNDLHGHAAGDAVLRAVSAAVTEALRAGDVLGRLGGEEFALVLEGSTAVHAIEVAERLRETIAALRIPGFPGLSVTASFGIASASRDCLSVEDLLASADTQLYVAKRSGRNQTRATADLPRLVA
jgi:diguanylate cyclase (GGDEF)-like protein